jgi:hypothetical protein
MKSKDLAEKIDLRLGREESEKVSITLKRWFGPLAIRH